MKSFHNLPAEVGRVLDRHKIQSYRKSWTPRDGVLEIETGRYDLKFNVNHKTLMISGRSVSHPRAIPFIRWFVNLDLARLGLDPEWWKNHGHAVRDIIALIGYLEAEPLAAVENPDAVQDEPPPADELSQFQTVVNVTMRDGAHAAPV